MLRAALLACLFAGCGFSPGLASDARIADAPRTPDAVPAGDGPSSPLDAPAADAPTPPPLADALLPPPPADALLPPPPADALLPPPPADALLPPPPADAKTCGGIGQACCSGDTCDSNVLCLVGLCTV